MDERCKHGSLAPQSSLLALPDSQGGRGRHKCTNCAYYAGKQSEVAMLISSSASMETCSHGRIAPTQMLSNLPESQAGTGRHKCCVCAFAAGFADGVAGSVPEPSDESVVLQQVQPPSGPRKRIRIAVQHVQRYCENDQHVAIGLRGELLVLNCEKERLLAAEKPDLAELVEHVSITRGDGLGYDILSFGVDGTRRYVEVKTTVGSKDAPFYLTRNELEFSASVPANYYLHRVFDLNRKPQFYVLAGNLHKLLKLDPAVYLAYPY